MLGTEHLVAKQLRDKIHEHSVASADKLMKSRRMLERSSYRQNRKRPRVKHRTRTSADGQASGSYVRNPNGRSQAEEEWLNEKKRCFFCCSIGQ